MSAHININEPRQLPENPLDLTYVRELQQQLLASYQRGLLIYQAPRETCKIALHSLLQVDDVVLLSNETDLEPSAVSFSKAETLLGLEAEIVVLDCFSGLNIDVFCMAAGLLRAGGIMLLLAPENWSEHKDPYGSWQEAEAIAESQLSTNFFIPYFKQAMSQSPVTLCIESGCPVPAYGELPDAIKTEMINGQTLEQNRVLGELNEWLKLKQKKLFILTADRGRGKSTLLGDFASQQTKKTRLVVTAASRAQASILLGKLEADTQLKFLAPDTVAKGRHKIDLLIIDEAAMIAGGVLRQCMEGAEKIIMATTTGGYEGTGQGFLLKFMADLPRHDYVHASIESPVRWGQNDELEKTINETLLLDHHPAMNETAVRDIQIEVVDKKDLNNDYATFKDIYTLLVSAHYRTRPSDFRQLMDDGHQLVICARYQQQLVGVLLLNREGGFSAELSHDVFMGKRRPRGHLLAQMLTAQAGIRDFACYRGLRVQRITVHEQYRRRGIATALIKHSEKLLEQLQLDYLGSSFALNASLTTFWNKLGFLPVHIGVGKGKSTARQTLVVLKSEKPQIKISMQVLSAKIKRDLPLWLTGICNDMMWQDVIALLKIFNIHYVLNRLDEDEIESFSTGYRGFELTQPVLQRFMINQVNCLDNLDEKLQRLMVEKILLNYPWSECSEFKGPLGKKGLTRKIRDAINACNK